MGRGAAERRDSSGWATKAASPHDSILHAGLVEHGRKHGARGLTAEVLFGNTRMMRVFHKGAHSLSVKTHGGVEELTMLFD